MTSVAANTPAKRPPRKDQRVRRVPRRMGPNPVWSSRRIASNTQPDRKRVITFRAFVNVMTRQGEFTVTLVMSGWMVTT